VEEKSNLSIIEKIIHFFDHNAVILMILLFELLFLFFFFRGRYRFYNFYTKLYCADNNNNIIDNIVEYKNIQARYYVR
jgi:hypothetical protein